MKKTVLILLLLCMYITAGWSQGSARKVDFQVHCLGIEMDGSQTLRVSGYGRKRSDAREQAKKNAVWAVIFYGVHEGAKGCNTKPLVTEVNARERHEDYFNSFFADEGPYLEYVSLEDRKRGSTTHKKDDLGVTYHLTLRVLCPQLKKRLKDDGIIK